MEAHASSPGMVCRFWNSRASDGPRLCSVAGSAMGRPGRRLLRPRRIGWWTPGRQKQDCHTIRSPPSCRPGMVIFGWAHRTDSPGLMECGSRPFGRRTLQACGAIISSAFTKMPTERSGLARMEAGLPATTPANLARLEPKRGFRRTRCCASGKTRPGGFGWERTRDSTSSEAGRFTTFFKTDGLPDDRVTAICSADRPALADLDRARAVPIPPGSAGGL